MTSTRGSPARGRPPAGPAASTRASSTTAARDGRATAEFTAHLPVNGTYEVQVAWVAAANRASNVPVVITHDGGATTVRVDQRAPPALEGHFTAVGRFPFRGTGVVTLSNSGTDGHVAVDAVRWVPVP